MWVLFRGSVPHAWRP